MKFDCSKCTSFCCVVPPMLQGEAEIKKAKAFGVRIIAVAMESGYTCSVVKNHHGRCPFVSDKGCRIYGNNFKVCSEFSCKAKEYSFLEIKNKNLIDTMKLLTESTAPIKRPELFSLDIIKKYNIEIVSREVAVDLVNASSFEEVSQNFIALQQKWV